MYFVYIYIQILYVFAGKIENQSTKTLSVIVLTCPILLLIVSMQNVCTFFNKIDTYI